MKNMKYLNYSSFYLPNLSKENYNIKIEKYKDFLEMEFS